MPNTTQCTTVSRPVARILEKGWLRKIIVLLSLRYFQCIRTKINGYQFSKLMQMTSYIRYNYYPSKGRGGSSSPLSRLLATGLVSTCGWKLLNRGIRRCFLVGGGGGGGGGGLMYMC